jgi:hypothetical protein
MGVYEGSSGPATDQSGNPVIDPTKNVLDLVEAAVARINDLMALVASHDTEIRNLERAHAKELRQLEAERINAIRAVDVAASQQQQKDAEVRASALAKQVSDAAEQQRGQVAAAATAAATSLAAALVPIQERLAELTRLQYEQQGQKQQVVEGRAQGGTVGMWAGVGVAAVFGILTIVALLLSYHHGTAPSTVTVTVP